MKPASPSGTPRATSIAGPKATTATRLALKQPQAKPALSASPTSRRGSRARHAGGPAALPCARGGSRYAKAISTSPRAAATAVVATAIRHEEAVATPPSVAAARPRPTGQLESMMAIAVVSSPSANQSATILASRMFMSTAPMPLRSRPVTASAKP